jgi:hypothetical protein
MVTLFHMEQYYDIPNASSYKLGSDLVVYRRLKSGKMRPLRTQVEPIRHGRNRLRKRGLVKITFDDGKRKSIEPSVLLRKIKSRGSVMRDAPRNYVSLDGDLCPLFFVNQAGDVLRIVDDSIIGVYLKEVPYHGIRISLSDSAFRARSYTRAALQRLYKEHTGYMDHETLLTTNEY